MFLSAVFVAAALQAAPSAAAPSAPPSVQTATPFARAPRMPGQRSYPECRRATEVRKEGDQSAKPLNRMPWALGERAVLRMVDGCPVRTPIVQAHPAR